MRLWSLHPQLQRFVESSAPRAAIARYLRAVQVEAGRRGYRFDASKIGRARPIEPHPVFRVVHAGILA